MQQAAVIDLVGRQPDVELTWRSALFRRPPLTALHEDVRGRDERWEVRPLGRADSEFRQLASPS